jgi:monoterpene epsilon-lactone hydrolase
MSSREFEELRIRLMSVWKSGGVPLEEASTAFEEIMASYRGDSDGVTCEKIVCSGIPASWVTASKAEEQRVVLYLHAGGLTMGSVQSHLPIISMISHALAAKVLAIEYRMAPEHKFPAALDDCVAAYRWLIDSGVSPKQLVIVGTSAGAGLAISMLLVLRDHKDPKPAAVACLCPFADMTLQSDSLYSNNGNDWITRSQVENMVASYLDGADREQPLVSPVFANLLGLPPIYIQSGRSEILVDDARRLAAFASSDGVHVELDIWPDMIHLWQLFAPAVPEGKEAIEKMARALKAWVKVWRD